MNLLSAVSVADAVEALNVAVTGLLPAVDNADFAPDISVNPVKTHPAGIGGYIGLHQTPVGAIHARRLKAQVVIRVKAESLAALSGSESLVANALIGANPANLRSQGIYRISRDTEFGEIYQGVDQGLDVAAGKDIRFDIDFEFQQPPKSPEGLIDSISSDLLLNTGDGSPRVLYQADFDSDPLTDFTPIDDSSTSSGPGNWLFNSTLGRIEQNADISGGSNAFNASKRGTYLLLSSTAVAEAPQNCLLQAEVGADSGGIGLVFNFQDIDNFYFFIMSLPTPYRFLGKKIGGSFSFLDSGGQDNGNAYSPGDHSLRLIQQNGEFELAVDHTPVLQGREDTLPTPGSVGFLSRNSATARFQSLRWLGL